MSLAFLPWSAVSGAAVRVPMPAGRLGHEPVAAHGEVHGPAIRGHYLPAEADLREGHAGRDVPVADQPPERGEDAGLPGGLAVIEQERPGAAAVPDGELLADDRRVADDGPGGPLAVVVHPDHDLDLPAVQPDVVGRLRVQAAAGRHRLGVAV